MVSPPHIQAMEAHECLFSATDTPSSYSLDESSTKEESVWYKFEDLDEIIQSLDCIFTASQENSSVEFGSSVEEQELLAPLEISQTYSQSLESNIEDLPAIFAKWLRANSDRVTIADFRNIKLKTSTIQNAMKTLGGGQKGMADLLKLILAWVEGCHLPEKQQKNEEEDPQSIKLFTAQEGTDYHSFTQEGFELSASPYPLQNSTNQAGAMVSDAYDALLESPKAARTRVARRDRMARQRWSLRRAYIQSPKPLPFTSQAYSIPLPKPNNPLKRSLKLLLQKELKHTDVGNLGRIVLPKNEAELNLPYIASSDGIKLVVEDWSSCKVWSMRYRFWANNKSRIYLLENTGDFVSLHQMKPGDYMMLYIDANTGNLFIRGLKLFKQDSFSRNREKSPFSSSCLNLRN